MNNFFYLSFKVALLCIFLLSIGCSENLKLNCDYNSIADDGKEFYQPLIVALENINPKIIVTQKTFSSLYLNILTKYRVQKITLKQLIPVMRLGNYMGISI